MIIVNKPLDSYLSYQKEIDEAVLSVLRSGIYIHGQACERFEKEFAKWLGTKHAIGVANGTDALRVAMLALGIKPGDEVITVSHTAVATVAAIESVGAVPVLVDVDPRSYTMNCVQVEGAITPKTKAVIAVHLYGNAVDMESLKEITKQHRIFLIEDCAQAQGTEIRNRKVGTLGDISCFSFYPTKNMGAFGDGGMVATSQDLLAEKCRRFREYGWKEKFISECAGINSRLDEVQAAILSVKLKHLDSDNESRMAKAKRYDAALKGLGLVLPLSAPEVKHSYHLYVVQTEDQVGLLKTLKEHGVLGGVHYPMPVHVQPAYQGRVRTAPSMSVTEELSRHIVTLPLYPQLADREQDQVIAAVKAWGLARKAKAA